MKTKSDTQYFVEISSALEELFENKDFMKSLEDEDNATNFIHALANLVPTNIYSKLTNQELTMLDFNHIANRLCFQYGTMKDE